ncbi:hypothetical protein BX666DRAFT_1883930 [Dichotomocladium elegans]|nr:hypothetical protein BX666DRAFT_1883930 [Dichotomocladium elegans]
MQPDLHALRPFSATLHIAHAAPLQIEIAEGQSLRDLVAHLAHVHSIPEYQVPSIISVLMTAMSEAGRCKRTNHRQGLSQTGVVQHDEAVYESPRSRFVNLYQTNVLQYHNKPEEDVFPRAYHTLVHCPIEAMYNTLLSLEQDYALAIQERYMSCKREQADIEERHNREIEASPGSSQTNMTHLFARHVEDMEVFQATWASDIMQTQETQRREYRLFVIELYREYQRRLVALAEEKNLKPEEVLIEAERSLDGKDIVKTAAERVRLQQQQQQPHSKKSTASPVDEENCRSTQKSSPASMLSQVSSSGTSVDQMPTSRSLSELRDKTSKMVHDIEEMGFTKEQAETALELTNQQMEQAVMLLLEDPNRVSSAIQQQRQCRRSSSMSQVTAPSPAHSRTSSLNDNSVGLSQQVGSPTSTTATTITAPRRHSLQRNISLAKSNNMAQPNKSWSPISFLQQQKQVMENTNLSSVRKLGGWLGKAMENFGIDHEESDPRFGSHPSATDANAHQQPVESFTISLGPAQVKSTHNLRLLVADTGRDIFNPMPYDPTREMAYKAQTSTKLYTNLLSAMVVLVELNELNRSRDQQGSAYGWRQYRTGKGSNQALFERCQHSTEFHFPDIEAQLVVIEQDFESRPDALQEGSFFVTRHSNLPTTQVVFHLVVDAEAVASSELSKKSNLMKGLLNILRLTTRYDISTLSIPLLLLPDRFLEQPEQFFSSVILDQPQQHLAWLLKRSEVTMKCVRGFLIEHSGSGKRVQGEGVDRTETVFGGGLTNIEFLLPDYNPVYGGGRSDVGSGQSNQQDVVEFAFQKFRISLVSIFQTS